MKANGQIESSGPISNKRSYKHMAKIASLDKKTNTVSIRGVGLSGLKSAHKILAGSFLGSDSEISNFVSEFEKLNSNDSGGV